ncbi:ABC transporter [Actinoplanes sp. SE50]|uniref:GTPase family protein n=1 Tax=unclassified Actinoplanes TaxID=2626549 RepID=UPI00023ED162|nr:MULTISPECIES: GTPase [unclassified Actinoplanes]AEV81097.1 putative ABC transporter [Actinoplanes sp. SE50/110]ATO79498.1 ABC transporter [Actinoplanes sp. SE50]SLL96898.1 ABC transporter [Actinoplanes sp. SE50/110]
MSLVENVRDTGRVDAESLTRRLEALSRFLRLVDPYLPDSELVTAHTVVERASGRLTLSLDHTVVALAGSTGSGKSSLFNALARFKLSPVGVRRPTTGTAHAVVWGPLEPASRLLDWVGVLPRQRFVRESALDGDDEASLRGLVLLDLPDFDSIEQAHQLEVDRLLGLVDQIVWVVDPQKYGDRILHRAYLSQFNTHAGVTIVVLNQADRLSAPDTEAVLTDLRRLLDDDGLSGAPVLATSAKQPGMLNELRSALEGTVAGRQAALRRLAADVDVAGEELAAMMGPPAAEDEVDRATVRQLTDALAASAGVPAVADAAAASYRLRAAAATGWPLVRGLRRLRPDPLRKLHLGEPVKTDGVSTDVVPRTSLPEADAAQKSAVGLSVRTVAKRAAAPLPEVWAPALNTAARSKAADLPDALDRAIATTDLGTEHRPAWWRLVGGLQWVLLAAATAGLLWLILGYVMSALKLPDIDGPHVGSVPLATVLLLGGLFAGLLLWLLLKPVVEAGGRRARRQAEQKLRAAVTDVGRQYVVAPVREVLNAYAQAREALGVVRSE